jgi:hypothetical protein
MGWCYRHLRERALLCGAIGSDDTIPALQIFETSDDRYHIPRKSHSSSGETSDIAECFGRLSGEYQVKIFGIFGTIHANTCIYERESIYTTDIIIFILILNLHKAPNSVQDIPMRMTLRLNTPQVTGLLRPLLKGESGYVGYVVFLNITNSVTRKSLVASPS